MADVLGVPSGKQAPTTSTANLTSFIKKYSAPAAPSGGAGAVLGVAPKDGLKMTNVQNTTSALPEEHGVTGFLGNLGNDVRTSVVGLPTGLVQLAKHPVGSVEAMGKSTWQDWSPLVHATQAAWNGKNAQAGADVSQFGHQFYAHPLAPLLDVASVLSGGAAIAGKGAKLGVDSGLLSDTGKFANAGRSEAIPFTKLGRDGVPIKTLYKYTGTNPLSKALQKTVHKAVNAGAAHLPGWAGDSLSMDNRYTRLEAKMLAPRKAAQQTQIHAFVKAARDLDPKSADYQTYRGAVNEHSWNQLLHMGDERDAKQPLSEEELYVKDPKKAGFTPTKGGTMESDANGFAKRYTTSNVKDAYKVPGRNSVIAVPNHYVKGYTDEWGSSLKSLKVIDKPAQMWKMILLGYNPGFLTHNAVGNFFMHAMHHSGMSGMRSYLDSVAQVGGEAKAIRGIGDTARTMRLNPTWMDKNFRDQLNNTFAASQKAGLRNGMYKYSMFPITHAVGDQFFRRASINAEMRDAPEVHALMKQGQSYNQAAENALSTEGKTAEGRAAAQHLRNRVSQKVFDTMGDYHTLTPAERAVTKALPFYTWMRHATRFAKNTALHHPGKLDVSAKLSNQGVAETQKELGQIPSYLLGSIPGHLLGIKSSPGRSSLLETNSLTPLATIADEVDAIRTALPGNHKGLSPAENIGFQLNPIISGIAKYLGQSNEGTEPGAQESKLGLGGVLKDTALSLPQATLIQRLLKGNASDTTKSGDPELFAKNKQASVTGLLGAHVEQMSKQAAQADYNKQMGVKAPKKVRGFSFGGGLSFPKS